MEYRGAFTEKGRWMEFSLVKIKDILVNPLEISHCYPLGPERVMVHLKNRECFSLNVPMERFDKALGECVQRTDDEWQSPASEEDKPPLNFCSRCGDIAIVVSALGGFRVECSGCSNGTRAYPTVEAAVAAWNAVPVTVRSGRGVEEEKE